MLNSNEFLENEIVPMQTRNYTPDELSQLKHQLETNGYEVSDDPQEIIFVHDFLME